MTPSERDYTMSEKLLSRLKRERGSREIICHMLPHARMRSKSGIELLVKREIV